MKKLPFILITMMAILLCSCGAKRNSNSGGFTFSKDPSTPFSENNIKAYILESDSTIDSADLTIDAFNITKRQTNTESKTDYIWASLSASNEEMDYEAEYYLVAILYNDGWIIEKYDKEYSHYSAKVYPDFEDINNAVYSTGVISELDWASEMQGSAKNNHVEFAYYHCLLPSQNRWFDLYGDVIVKCNYYPSSGWNINAEITSETSELNTDSIQEFIGTWLAVEDNQIWEIELTINSIDKEQISMHVNEYLIRTGELTLSEDIVSTWETASTIMLNRGGTVKPETRISTSAGLYYSTSGFPYQLSLTSWGMDGNSDGSGLFIGGSAGPKFIRQK